MESIKLNVTKELRMSGQVRLRLHTCRSLSMCVKVTKNLLFLCNRLSRKSMCCTQSVLNFVEDLLSIFVKNDSFMKQTKLLPKEEITQAINQEEKCKVYHSYFYIPDTLFILYIQQYLLCFYFWNPVPKFLIPLFCSYNIIPTSIFPC